MKKSKIPISTERYTRSKFQGFTLIASLAFFVFACIVSGLALILQQMKITMSEEMLLCIHIVAVIVALMFFKYLHKPHK